MSTPVVPPLDRNDVRRAARAQGLVAEFNDAGVLVAADVQIASQLADLCGESDEQVLLAAAFAVRAPRIGHVCTDLATIRTTATVESDEPVDLGGLPWPDEAAWAEALAGSPMVAVGNTGGDDGPLRMIGTLIYLDRYWREEVLVARELAERSVPAGAAVDRPLLTEGLARLFRDYEGEPPDLQRAAAAVAVVRRLAVVAGGPGTGKTTTVARVLALLFEQAAAADQLPPRVALATPTGKAAARLEEAVHGEARNLDVSDEVRASLVGTGGVTLHRLLGWLPGGRYRHHRRNRLPHDVVVVDETSMVSLSMMAKVLEAVRRDARVVLVGDPDQLASIEAGAVLGDVVGRAADTLMMGSAVGDEVAEVTGEALPVGTPFAEGALGDAIVVLRHAWRFGPETGLAAFAEAVRRGDADAAVGVLRDGRDDVLWIEVDVADDAAAEALAPVRERLIEVGTRLREEAIAGRRDEAMEALGELRLLCGHRRGPYGAQRWQAQAQRWLGVSDATPATRWYPGRPLLVTANDYALQLFNGDTGVVVSAGDGRAAAVFERRGELVDVSPTLLSSVETVYAMTVHKAQGSQFASVALLLPDVTSRILTRELLYTGATRARSSLTLIGTEAAVRKAVTTRISRASGLRSALWGTAGGLRIHDFGGQGP